MSGIIFLVLIILFITAIVFWIICYKSFKKHENKKAVNLLIIGLLLLIPQFYGAVRLLSIKNNINILGNINFEKEYTKLNEEINEIIYFNIIRTNNIVGMNIEINGFINGNGKFSIIRPPFDEKNGIVFDFEGNINENIKNIDWYFPQFLIEFIPENELVEGKILVNIQLY